MTDQYKDYGFADYMREDQFLYDLVDRYCQLFDDLNPKEQLAKFKMIFGKARGSAQSGVHNGVPYSTNRNSVAIHIKYLCETIYENRRIAKHEDARKLQRYLPQYLTNDDRLLEMITGYTPLREMRKTFAVKIMHPRHADTKDERGQHIVFWHVPDGLSESEAGADFKLLQRVCREARE